MQSQLLLLFVLQLRVVLITKPIHGCPQNVATTTTTTANDHHVNSLRLLVTMGTNNLNAFFFNTHPDTHTHTLSHSLKGSFQRLCVWGEITVKLLACNANNH